MLKCYLLSTCSLPTYGPRCSHSGPCGDRGHRGFGHGYCQFCRLCN